MNKHNYASLSGPSIEVISFDDKPSSRTVALYLAIRGSINNRDATAHVESMRVAAKESAKPATSDESDLRGDEIKRISGRILGFLWKVREKENGEDIINEIKTSALVEEIDLSVVSAKNVTPSTALQLKRLALLLEKEFGMPPDAER